MPNKRSSGDHQRRLVQPSNKLQLLQQRYQEWLSPGVTTSQQSVCSVLYQINTAGSSAVCLPSVRHLPPTIHRLEKHFFSLFLSKSFTFLRLVPLKRVGVGGGGEMQNVWQKKPDFPGMRLRTRLRNLGDVTGRPVAESETSRSCTAQRDDPRGSRYRRGLQT